MWQRAMRYMNYKPGWWALYFVYCSIPISLYVWYLTRRSKDVVCALCTCVCFRLNLDHIGKAELDIHIILLCRIPLCTYLQTSRISLCFIPTRIACSIYRSRL